jgi:hypothetical protein
MPRLEEAELFETSPELEWMGTAFFTISRTLPSLPTAEQHLAVLPLEARPQRRGPAPQAHPLTASPARIEQSFPRASSRDHPVIRSAAPFQ